MVIWKQILQVKYLVFVHELYGSEFTQWLEQIVYGLSRVRKHKIAFVSPFPLHT